MRRRRRNTREEPGPATTNDNRLSPESRVLLDSRRTIVLYHNEKNLNYLLSGNGK